MLSLTAIARVRMLAMYGDAFGRMPPSFLQPDGSGTSPELVSRRNPWRHEAGRLKLKVGGIRMMPILMSDGLFEHSFRVFDVDEPVSATRAVFAFAKRRWPIFIGASEDVSEMLGPDSDIARAAEAHGADELWVCDEVDGLDCERIQLALIQVYQPVLHSLKAIAS